MVVYMYYGSSGSGTDTLYCNFNVVFLQCCFTLHSMKLTGNDGDVLFDFSKNIVSEKTMQLLFGLVSHNY